MKGGQKRERSEGRLKRKEDEMGERERLKWDVFIVLIIPPIG
jgi:hypothetical protein